MLGISLEGIGMKLIMKFFDSLRPNPSNKQVFLALILVLIAEITGIALMALSHIIQPLIIAQLVFVAGFGILILLIIVMLCMSLLIKRKPLAEN